MNRRRPGAKLLRVLTTIVLTLILATGWATPVAAEEEGRWGFGTDLGFWAETADDTLFAMSFSADYFFDPAISVGPRILFSPGGDLTQVAFGPVVKYHVRLKALRIVPQAGVGFITGDFDREVAPGSESDTSYYIPLGVAMGFPVTRKLELTSSFLLNLHDLDYRPFEGRDQTSFTVLFGMRFRP